MLSSNKFKFRMGSLHTDRVKPPMARASWKFSLGTALLALVAQCGPSALAQMKSDGAPARAKWAAQWISHPTAPLREPITLHFKKTLELATVPAHFVVHVSADNRFVLYVNGQRVGDGPARGDLTHWRYQTFDLAPMLKAGTNVLAATVWNFGVYAPVAQISDRTAFLLEGDTDAEARGQHLPIRAGLSKSSLDRCRCRVSTTSFMSTWPWVPARRFMPISTTGIG